MHRIRLTCIITLTASTALLVACGDSTAPNKALSVAVTVDQTPAARLETDPGSGYQLIVCDLGLTARATGAGSATWEESLARFSYGTDRATTTDSIVVPAGDARELWGGEIITPNTPQQTSIEVSATAPFTTVLEFRYRANAGEIKTATVSFSCEPSRPG